MSIRRGSVWVWSVVLSATPMAGEAYESTTPGKPGTGGLVPVLTGAGPLSPDSSTNAIGLSDALPGGAATLVIGFSELAGAFKGGVLGPSVDLLVEALPVDASGGFQLPFELEDDAPVGFSLWTQFWISDPGASLGLSASNTLRLTIQPGIADALFPGLAVITEGMPTQAHLADLDGDGMADLLIPADANGIHVRRSTGCGVVEVMPSIPLPASSDVRATATSDLDGDGDLDVVFAEDGDGRFVKVACGNGDATFQPVFLVSALTGQLIHSLSLGDLDGNGTLDMALIQSAFPDNSLLTVKGDGNGDFFDLKTFPLPGDPGSPVVADVDLDGLADVIVSTDDQDQILLLPSLGDGDLGPPSVVATLAGSSGSPAHVLVADLDGGGVPDLIVMDRSADVVSIHHGDGLGGFGAPVQQAAGPSPTHAALGRIDDDLWLDLVVVNFAAQGQPGWASANVLLGQPGGVLAAPIEVSLHSRASDVALGDVDADGLDDLLFSRSSVPITMLRRNRPDAGSFDDVQTLAGSPFVDGLAVGDLGGDGLPDLVICRADGISVATAGPGAGLVSVTQHALGALARDVAIADLDGDGFDDVVMASFAEYHLLLGQSEGGVLPSSIHPASAGSDPTALAVGDLDGDGIADVAVASRDDHTVAVLLGGVGGGLGAPTAYPSFHLPLDIVLGDLDLDGDLDAVTASSADRVETMLGDGQGVLSQFAVYPMGTALRVVALGDVTGDGVLDVLTAGGSPGDGAVLLRRGTGLGTLEDEQALLSGEEFMGLDVADLDGDGHLDLLVSLREHDRVELSLGMGAGVFDPPVPFAVGEGPLAVVTGCLDEDDRPDLAVVNGGQADVSVLYQR